jgi:hypothetical protein
MHIHNKKILGHRLGVIVINTLESIYMVGQGETKNFAGSFQPKIWMQNLPYRMQECYSLEHSIW